jgi:hypothetical protein
VASTTLPGLPVATSLTGAEQVWININAVDYRTTTAAIAELVTGGGGSGSSNAYDTLTIFRDSVVPLNVNVVQINGYRTVNDGGAMSIGRVTTQARVGPGMWQSADGAIWRIENNEPNILMLGGYNDGSSHQITSADIAANPQWIGTYTAGTEWNSVAGQELVYTCYAGNSVAGTVRWNTNTGQINRPMNLLPGGTYVSNQTILIVAAGFYMHGNQRATSELLWTGSPTVPALYLNSGAYFTIERLRIADTSASNQLIVLDHSSSPGAISTQQGSFRDCDFVGGGPVFTNVIISINPVSSGSGQGDTLLFSNCLLIGSAVANLQLVGQNTLSCEIEGGNHQEALGDGIQLLGASAFMRGPSFENSAIDFFHQAPATNQIAMFGADFHSYSGAGGTEINSMRDIRSENLVPCIFEANNGRVYCLGVSGGMVFGWVANGNFPLGGLIGAGSKNHIFMLVDDGGPDWFLGDPSGSTTLVVNPSATWTTNQWAGFLVWERFTNGFALATSLVVSNTATTATVTPLGLTSAGRQIKIAGVAGSSPPSWDSAPAGHSTPPVPGNGQGFTTVANSNVVNIGSDITVSIGDYVVIPGAWSLAQAGESQTSALIGKVTNTGAGTITLSRAATQVVTDAPGYFGTSISDGNFNWLDIDSDALVGLIKGDAIFSPYGRVRQCGPLDAMSLGRPDWYRGDVPATGFNSRSYPTSNEALAEISQGAGTLSLATYIALGPLVTVGVVASCTFSWPSEFVGVQSFEINAQQSGSGDIVITMSGAWKGPATVDLGSSLNKITHISAQWDLNLSTWVFRGSSGPY